MATQDAAAAAAMLARHAETIPLVPHRAAATSADRREGVVISSTIISRKLPGIRREDEDNKGNIHSRWTEEEAIRALEDCPYEEHLGLRFYLEDPLPRIRQACVVSKKMFIDHEFPTYPEASVILKQKGRPLRPGIITPSNCRDFVEEGGKRAKRIPHFASKAESKWEWIRASSMSGSSIFSCEDSIDPRNVLQGQVGNCGFCSGFASLAAQWPELIRCAFGQNSEECLQSYGAYSLRLYPRGRRRFLLLDDHLLSVRNDRSHGSPSLHSMNEQDLWIRLLEKAFVKLQGSYASLDGHYKFNSLYRHPARAMQILTNAPVALEIHYARREVDAVYETLIATQGVCARVAHCRRTVDGLRSNHGYSLLWVGEAGGFRLVCLRNPHGRGSYAGRDWGVGSSLWREEGDVTFGLLEKNECFARCELTGRVTWWQSGHSHHDSNVGADDGIFFMGFATFIECFPITTLVGPVVPDYNKNKSSADENGAVYDVPDCVYRVKRNLSCVKEVLAMAMGHDG